MFLKNLSTSILQICDVEDLTYESASERCKLSSRYFGDIVRGQTSPSVDTLEKLCVGLETTPDALLLRPQSALQVSHGRCFRCALGLTVYPVCPGCGITLEREFQNFCNDCGQALDWRDYQNATLILPGK